MHIKKARVAAKGRKEKSSSNRKVSCTPAGEISEEAKIKQENKRKQGDHVLHLNVMEEKKKPNSSTIRTSQSKKNKYD